MLALLLILSCWTGMAQASGGLQISVTPDTRMTGRSNHSEVLMRIQVVRGAESAGVPCVRVPSMKELGMICGVDVPAAAAGLLK